MEIWTWWIALISSGVDLFNLQFGLSEALSIALFTVLARLLLTPLSLRSAYKMHKNKLAIEAIKPQLEQLRTRHSDNPAELARRTMGLYKKKGIKFLDSSMVMNIGSQGLLGLGLFQSLRAMSFHSPFLWIENIAKPDVVLAFFVGLLTFLSVSLAPNSAEQINYLIVIVPAVITVLVLVGFPSVIGISWASSNIVTLVQHGLLRLIIARENSVATSS